MYIWVLMWCGIFVKQWQKFLFLMRPSIQFAEAVACHTKFACHCAKQYEIYILWKKMWILKFSPREMRCLIAVLTTISYINVWTSSSEEARSEENRSLLGFYQTIFEQSKIKCCVVRNACIVSVLGNDQKFPVKQKMRREKVKSELLDSIEW